MTAGRLGEAVVAYRKNRGVPRRLEAIYKPFLTMPIVVKLCKVDETIFKKVITVAA